MDFEKLKGIFKKYVEQFDMSDAAIERKYYHSLRVMEISKTIAENNNFNEEDIDICTIAGLLHDYARFEQWTKYQTYSDLKSIDHGDLAAQLLFEDGDISNYTNNLSYYDEIEDAIKYHNKSTISDDMSKHNSTISKVIRDADKLDIFYIFGINKELLKEDNQIPSKEVINEFYQNKPINRQIVKNESDNILLNLAMVFDLNFNFSYKCLKENELIEKMYANINNKELFKEYFDYINKYIEERID